jgi:chaperonin GroEL
MAKDFLFGAEARNALFEGATILNNAVKISMGAKGRNCLIDMGFNNVLTKDGVSIANQVVLEDPVQNMGANVIKQAANNTNEQAGDGTTTTTVLAHAILKNSMAALDTGHNPVQMKRGMDKALDLLKVRLSEISTPIDLSGVQVEQIATISANGDSEIGKLVAKAITTVGLDGAVTVETAKGLEDSLEVVEGLQIDRGYVSSYFVTNTQKMIAELKNPLVVIIDDKVVHFGEIVELLTQLQQKGRPVLLIAEDYEDDVLSTIIANKANGALDITAIKAPGFGDNKTDMLTDIALLTNATIISPRTIPQQQARIEHCGVASKIIVGKTNTVIVCSDDEQLKTVLNNRVTEIKAQIQESKNEYHTKNLKTRLAKITGGVAILHITAQTEIELKEKKDRVDDSLNACKASIEEGIVPGGGTCLYHLGNDNYNTEHVTESELIGFDIVIKSLKAPLETILYNAGLCMDDFTKVVGKHLGAGTDTNIGLNALTGEACNLIEAGIIDPAKVERVALENAISVASSLITTECTISNKLPKK